MTITIEAPAAQTGLVPEETEPHEIGISVVFCSRGRPVQLARALHRMIDLADRPDEIEMIIGVDPDDTTVGDSPLPSQARFWVAPERYGYTGLHRYLNELDRQARGTWCFWVNDDMVVETQGWDTVMRSNREAILWPRANHVHHANIAPAWPRSWSQAVGYVTPTTHMDTWLQGIGDRLGRHDRVPITITHDRADVTGNNDDDTYHEGREKLGPEGMVEPMPWHLADQYIAAVRSVMDRG